MLASPEDSLFLFGGKTKGWLTKSSTEDGVDVAANSKPAATAPDIADDDKTAEYRTWTSVDGQFRVEARLVKFEDQVVHLQRKDDDRIIPVPLSKLSRADRLFVQQ